MTELSDNSDRVPSTIVAKPVRIGFGAIENLNPETVDTIAIAPDLTT